MYHVVERIDVPQLQMSITASSLLVDSLMVVYISKDIMSIFTHRKEEEEGKTHLNNNICGSGSWTS